MKYKEWLDSWLEIYVKPTVKIRTYEKYSQIVKNRIVEQLGEFELEKLTAIVLQNYVAEMIKTYSANSVYGTISVIQKSIKTAFMLGITKECNVDKIIRPKIVEKQVECFTIQEQKKIEEYCVKSKKDKMFGIVLTLYTGLRIGELLALTWEDIDTNKWLITVNKSCHYSKGKQIIDTPKTPQSNRVIPIPNGIRDYIKEMKNKSKCKYVISNNNKPISTRSYQNTFSLVLEKLKIKHKGFHSLRHTFATRAIECGIDVKTLSEILGHKNATITLNRYVHSLMEHKKEMMNRLSRFCYAKK